MWHAVKMNKVLVAVLLMAARPVWGTDLTPNQRLIVACFKLQVDEVVTRLREGADVNGRFGNYSDHADLFYDRWTGGLAPLGTDSWTPLIALANSPQYPDPPAELGMIWKDKERSDALRQKIPPEQIAKRQSDTMTILFVLLSHGCKLNCDDGYGATALYRAVDDGKVLMAKTLLQFGANPNTKTRVYIDGPGDTTPLHVACRSKELVQLLLAHGADASAKDSEGRTPADWVALDDQRDFDLVITPDGPRIRPTNKPQ